MNDWKTQFREAKSYAVGLGGVAKILFAGTVIYFSGAFLVNLVAGSSGLDVLKALARFLAAKLWAAAGLS